MNELLYEPMYDKLEEENNQKIGVRKIMCLELVKKKLRVKQFVEKEQKKFIIQGMK